ncbi:MAG TPA: ATP-binding protein [Actinomycetota bacterium]|nr:ATP-binding protein [Actinomycetota bacterium]
MEVVFTLCLPRDEASVPVARRICRDSLGMLGVTRDCVGEIELAVTEACTNVLKHVAATEDEYEVSVQINNANCEIRVIDTAGQSFDHESHGFEEAAVSAESGRGIFIMRAMVDELHFVSAPENGSVVHLVKKLQLEPDSVLNGLTKV